ncbi:MAG: SGNH/GDSL hydrolase family protein [Opitutaceae bacterium]
MTTRRQFIGQLAAAGLGGMLAHRLTGNPGDTPMNARDYLKSILYTREEVESWLQGEAFPFARYSSAFGWLLPDARFRDGVDNSISVYTYEPDDGPRIRVNYADRPCRINTYGDSFTQCHQVSDGETWQEVLAAHLQEPVRNFGIGGWSVYQAWLRLQKEEARTPADVIIFNIYDDDHFRNLDAWRNIRARKHERFIEPTLPHLAVNPAEGTLAEKPNPCPTEESLFNLCDLDWVHEHFKDDFALGIELAHLNASTANPREAYRELRELATTHGIVTRSDDFPTLEAAADALHREAALFSTRWLVGKIDAFASSHGKKLIYVLSYPADRIAEGVESGIRWDQPFVDFLKARSNPVIDLHEAHLEDHAANYKIELRQYLKRFFMGHYNPRGNAFCARAVKDVLVQVLDPKPPAYREDPGILK